MKTKVCIEVHSWAPFGRGFTVHGVQVDRVPRKGEMLSFQTERGTSVKARVRDIHHTVGDGENEGIHLHVWVFPNTIDDLFEERIIPGYA